MIEYQYSSISEKQDWSFHKNLSKDFNEYKIILILILINIHNMNSLAIILRKHHTQLTQEEWLFLENIGVVNWCWGKWQWLLVWILRKLSPYWVQASCKIHDFWYAKWWTEKRRQYCDQRFLQKMLEDWYEKINSKMHYLYYCLLAVIAYYLIRIYWKKFFNYYSK